jgi:hypothetical protein
LKYLASGRGIAEFDGRDGRGSSHEGDESKEPLHVDE